MLNQQPDGIPLSGFDANATDAIALLSRVNFGSVIKVLMAIEAIRLHTGVDVADIVRLTHSPAQPPTFYGDDYERVRATEQFAGDVARNPDVRPYYNELYLKRFR